MKKTIRNDLIVIILATLIILTSVAILMTSIPEDFEMSDPLWNTMFGLISLTYAPHAVVLIAAVYFVKFIAERKRPRTKLAGALNIISISLAGVIALGYVLTFVLKDVKALSDIFTYTVYIYISYIPTAILALIAVYGIVMTVKNAVEANKKPAKKKK